MKVMLVNGSRHLHGTTMTALEEMIKVFHSEEVETEVVQLGGKPIADCLQCNVCQKTGKCVIKDDGVNEFVEKAKTAVFYSGAFLCFLVFNVSIVIPSLISFNIRDSYPKTRFSTTL